MLFLCNWFYVLESQCAAFEQLKYCSQSFLHFYVYASGGSSAHEITTMRETDEENGGSTM